MSNIINTIKKPIGRTVTKTNTGGVVPPTATEPLFIILKKTTMHHTNKIFAISVIMLLLSLVGFCLTVNMIRGFSKLERLPATDSLSGNAGKYFIDLPQDIDHSMGTDMVARVSGDTVYVYYPDFKAHLAGIKGVGDYQIRLNRNKNDTGIISFTIMDINKEVTTIKDSLLYKAILKDNQ